MVLVAVVVGEGGGVLREGEEEELERAARTSGVTLRVMWWPMALEGEQVALGWRWRGTRMKEAREGARMAMDSSSAPTTGAPRRKRMQS
jgi:hypothetical protein